MMMAESENRELRDCGDALPAKYCRGMLTAGHLTRAQAAIGATSGELFARLEPRRYGQTMRLLNWNPAKQAERMTSPCAEPVGWAYRFTRCGCNYTDGIAQSVGGFANLVWCIGWNKVIHNYMDRRTCGRTLKQMDGFATIPALTRSVLCEADYRFLSQNRNGAVDVGAWKRNDGKAAVQTGRSWSSKACAVAYFSWGFVEQARAVEFQTFAKSAPIEERQAQGPAFPAKVGLVRTAVDSADAGPTQTRGGAGNFIRKNSIDKDRQDGFHTLRVLGACKMRRRKPLPANVVVAKR